MAWKWQAAKNKLIQDAHTLGPQSITERAVDTAVMSSTEEKQTLTKKPSALLSFFSNRLGPALSWI